MLLLDTCTLLWLASGSERLSEQARSLLRESNGLLFVSAISAFEIGIKHRKRALDLPLEPEHWYRRAILHHGLREVPVDGAIALRSTLLPPRHQDPCDRILVATAELRGLRILTPDPLVAAYDEADTVW